ncbi:hypothetical protein AMS68_000495 [Peltaster fructicola]|uniref:non-specific serine/threonine protein kinase n=1 Tax=Peltaster fructicola TaxID=286661 RepID=A0A6H0XK20_9PEZI|nr:hypothetical protein AMS68_000495 [Peltaster fructicola]
MATDGSRIPVVAGPKTKDDFLERYEVMEKIGRGSFGTIRKVRNRATGQVLARKEISYSKMSQREKEQLQAEIKVLERLHHPNIVEYQNRHHIAESQELHLYMEYCSNGDLGDYIKRLSRESRHADEQFVWSILAQLVSALFLCHTSEQPPEAGDEARLNKPKVLAGIKRKDENHIILHRDLKPENVFLTNGSTVKLGDFGLSRVMRVDDFASTYVGTPFYMSPEINSSEKYSAKSDIWSLGCVVYELCAQAPPFNGRNQIELIHNIRQGKAPELPSFYSKELRNLIKQCLKVSQDDRPNVIQLIQEPLVKLARSQLQMDAQKKSLLETQRQMESDIARLKQVEAEVVQLKEENHKLKHKEKQLEMEWHARAALEIQKRVREQVDMETARLMREYNNAVALLGKKPEEEVEKTSASTVDVDLSSMSLTRDTLATSPRGPRIKSRRPMRTPLTRAKTIAHAPGSPMDISPIKKTPLPAALTPTRKAPPPPRSPLRGRTLVQLMQSPAKWGPELGDDMPSPFKKDFVRA